MRKGCSIVISAPSGTGKSTLSRMLLAEFPNLHFSISCTTRPKRPNEIDGKDYIFLDQQDFIAKRDNGEFAEWAMVHGNFYGTPLAPLKSLLSQGNDILLDVDVQGAAQIKGSLPETFFIFIIPPSLKELENRLLKRDMDTKESIVRRLDNARLELYQANWYNVVIINDDIKEAYANLRSAYITATLSPDKQINVVNALLFEGK